jgi:hypothetical protein
MSPCARWAGRALQLTEMVRHVPLPVLWHMVALPWHGGTVDVGTAVPAVPVRVADAPTVEVRVADAPTVEVAPAVPVRVADAPTVTVRVAEGWVVAEATTVAVLDGPTEGLGQPAP